jgi:PKD domain
MPKAFLMRQLLLAVVALGLAGCTVRKTDIPDVTGPSTFAVSLSVQATPDNITADGSQSSVVASVVDANGAGVANVPLQVDITTVGDLPVQYGSLSARTIYTGSNGRANAVYAAPVASAFQAGGPPSLVWITVTPIGSNYETAIPQHAAIKVTPPPVPPPVVGAPTAAVTFTPTSPKVGQLVVFDATASQAGPGHTLVTYFWDFGDGLPNEEHGDDASHAYVAAGRYTMILGVADELGRISSTFNTIVVAP